MCLEDVSEVVSRDYFPGKLKFSVLKLVLFIHSFIYLGILLILSILTYKDMFRFLDWLWVGCALFVTLADPEADDMLFGHWSATWSFAPLD